MVIVGILILAALVQNMSNLVLSRILERNWLYFQVMGTWYLQSTHSIKTNMHHLYQLLPQTHFKTCLAGITDVESG